MNRVNWLIGACLVLLAGPAVAEGTRFPPIKDAATAKECSTCHIAFPPQLLPARSWQAILGNLGNHFGEDASVAAKDNAEIVAYLTAHAADAKATSGGTRYLKGIATTATPLRITEIPYWRRWHSEVSAARFKSPEVKSAANCVACHRRGAGILHRSRAGGVVRLCFIVGLSPERVLL